ncbi:WD repeat-containing protein 38 isoform X5 [Ovis aries]|uniref:WD repeat-containing protein 38 isoform X5 n=1 Tax=Ovis aries TaxID=9940 RepID=UPI002952744F|nr:WD repeat-containing protein 38 isoform X5 [Ovis aries]
MGLPIGQMGKQDPLQQACVPLALCLGSVQPQRLTRYVVLACPLAAAGRHPAPRPELPKVRLPAVRARKFLPGAIRGPACCCPTFPGLGTVSPRLPSHGFPETPERLRAPPRLPWRPLVHSFPLPLHLVLSQVRRPDQRPPRREPARAGGLRSMNSKPRGKLAVGRVKFFGRHRGEVNSSAFSPDGQRLLTASEDGCVYGWETQSGRLLWRLRGHKGPVRFCRFSPDGRLFASTSCDRTVRLWDAADAKCLQVLKGHQRSVETVSFSHDSKQLASGGWDKRVMLWEVQSGQVLRHFVGHRDSVQSSDFAPSSDCLATGSWDSTIRMWDLRARTPGIFHQELEGHRGNISCLCYSPSGLLVKVWDCNTGKCTETLKGVLNVAHACAFMPDGKLLVSGAVD